MRRILKLIVFGFIAAILLNRYAGIDFSFPPKSWDETGIMPDWYRDVMEAEPGLKRPDEVPLVNCSGDTIKWTWYEQLAWNDGRYRLVRDEERGGCVLYTVTKLKEEPAWMKTREPDAIVSLKPEGDE